MRTELVIGRSFFLLVALTCTACGGGSSSEQSQQIAGAVSGSPPVAAEPVPVLEDRFVKAEAGQVLTLRVDDAQIQKQAHLLGIEQAPDHGLAEVDGAVIRYTPNPNFDEDRFVLSAYNSSGDKATADVFVTVTFPSEPLPKIEGSPNCASGNCVAGEGYFGETCNHWLTRTGQNGLKAVRSTDTEGAWKNVWQHSNKCVYQGPVEMDFKNFTLISAGRCSEGDPDLMVFASPDVALKPVARCHDYVNSSRIYNTLVF